MKTRLSYEGGTYVFEASGPDHAVIKEWEDMFHTAMLDDIAARRHAQRMREVEQGKQRAYQLNDARLAAIQEAKNVIKRLLAV